MNEQSILVADSDPKNLQILKENLELAGFRVATVANGLQAWELIQKTAPSIVLSEVALPEVNGMQLLEKIHNNEQVAHIPLIFLTNKRELQDRVNSLKMGAKDYLVKPLHVKEVIAHIKMVLTRLDRRRLNGTNSYFKLMGKLEELSVFDLIESFGVERKTGILSITNAKEKTGQIYFKDGCVINANQGDFKKEKAIYQILPWIQGSFTMVFKDVNVPDEIAVSNLGLLLQGLKRMEQREKYLQRLPSKDMTFLPTSTFRNLLTKRKLSKDMVKFISLFDGKRDILTIIDSSSYDDLRTLELTVRLYKQGFIKPASQPDVPKRKISRPELDFAEPATPPVIPVEEKRPPKKRMPKSTPIRVVDEKPVEKPTPASPENYRNGTMPQIEKFSPPLKEPSAGKFPNAKIDDEILKTVVFNKKANRADTPASKESHLPKKSPGGLYILIGDPENSQESLFQIVTEDKYKTRSFNNIGISEIKIGQMKLGESSVMNMLSIPLDGKFNLLLDNYAEKLSAFSMIVDCFQPVNWQYIGYLSRMFHERYAAPFSLIALHLPESDVSSIEVLRDRLDANPKIPIYTCEMPLSKTKVENLLLQNVDTWSVHPDSNIPVQEGKLAAVAEF